MFRSVYLSVRDTEIGSKGIGTLSIGPFERSVFNSFDPCDTFLSHKLLELDSQVDRSLITKVCSHDTNLIYYPYTFK